MRKSAKKLLSGVLAGMMILSAAPVSALAANYEPGQVIDKADYITADQCAPEIQIVWTAYNGKDKIFR